MIDIPLNKALVAVENSNREINSRCIGDRCNGCYLHFPPNHCGAIHIACQWDRRKDGKNVIFKLVDLPEENTNG